MSKKINPVKPNILLTVEKIGGTSMSHFADILEDVIKGQTRQNSYYHRVFIVSAYGGVTDSLLENKKSKKPGIYAQFASKKNYLSSLDALFEQLVSINQGFQSIGLDLKKANSFLSERIELTKEYLISMSHVLSSGYVRSDNILLAAREMLASLGESQSAFNSTNILNNNGIKSKFIDLSGLQDDSALSIDERIKAAFRNVNPKIEIPIATGYAKGIEGIMREFDRGYSEVTFSKIACLLQAGEAVIHKEFHLCSADPHIVGKENAVVVGASNFDVADQLADVGMEAIHPKAAKPLEKKGICLRVKNAFDAKHPGTVITKNYIGDKSKVEIITGSNKVSLLEIHDTDMVGAIGFDLSVLEIFQKFGVSYILKATNANSISHLIWEKEKSRELIKSLIKKYETINSKEVAVVCAIGSNIAKPGILEQATSCLAKNKINIICISQSMRQVNMQFVIERKDYEKAIIALNKKLCLNQT